MVRPRESSLMYHIAPVLCRASRLSGLMAPLVHFWGVGGRQPEVDGPVGSFGVLEKITAYEQGKFILLFTRISA